MTVIAWDGKTLAADRLILRSGTRGTVTKIHRVNGDLLGASGNAANCSALVHWASQGFDPAVFPSIKEDEWAQLLRITAIGEIWVYPGSPYPVMYQDRFIATGSASDFAMAAMHLGVDAVGAVKVACALSAECGEGYDALDLLLSDEAPF